MADDGSVARLKDFESDVKRWKAEIESYDKAAERWEKAAMASIKEYDRARRDDQDNPDYSSATRFNIYWSSMQIQLPAIFSNEPVPDIRRRWKDRNDAARISAIVLERALSYEIEQDDLKYTFDRINFDYSLAGRGVPWVRFEPTFGDVLKEKYVATPLEDDHQHEVERGARVTQPGAKKGRKDHVHTLEMDEITGLPRWSLVNGHTHNIGDAPVVPAERDMLDENGKPLKEVVDQRAPVDYVHWKDFKHKPCKTWEDLRRNGWMARQVMMTIDAVVDRFGEDFKDVPCKHTPSHLQNSDAGKEVINTLKEAKIIEIWDIVKREAIWFCPDYPKLLDKRKDPLKLRDFFPAPRPVMTSITNESLIPTPDFGQYRALLDELDNVTDRIEILTRGLQIKGIYDASMEGLALLLSDQTSELEMIGVENMVALLAKSSSTDLQGVVQFMPIRPIAEVLSKLYESRELVKNLLYEVSGISDIIRGEVDPREKLGQSRIKGQFATLRLSTKQAEMARIARDTIRIKTEIIAEHFEPDMIRKISGFDTIADVEKMHRDGKQQEVEQLFQQVIELIQDDRTRGYSIDIETDSTLTIDKDQDKSSRVEFLTALGSFLRDAMPLTAQNPALTEIVTEAMMFGLRAFDTGRSIEGLFEDTMDRLVEQSKQPKPEKPDPKLLQIQSNEKIKGAELQQKERESQREHALESQELANNRETDTADVLLRGADMVQRATETSAGNGGSLDGRSPPTAAGPEAMPVLPAAPANNGGDPVTDHDFEVAMALIEAQSQSVNAAIQAISEATASMQRVAQSMNQPKQIIIERDEAGRVLGGTSVPTTTLQ